MSIKTVLYLFAVIALLLANYQHPSRTSVSILATLAVMQILYGMTRIWVGKTANRPYWIGFTVFGLGYYYLLGGFAYRDFYSLPGVVAEYIFAPKDAYTEWHRALRRDTDYSHFPNDPNYLTFVQEQTRYAANCTATIILSFVGGALASYIDKSSGERKM